MKKLSSWRANRLMGCAVVILSFVFEGSVALAKNHDSKFAAHEADEEMSAMSAQGPAPQVTATPSVPVPQIDGSGTIASPSGTKKDAQFFIFDVENEQVTPEFLEGEFGYLDKKSHINFSTGKIQTVTINGNQGAFTGTARIGGPRSKQIIQFTVTVTANNGAVPDTFSIVLSNGYAASGNLKSGRIVIQTLDPD
ncbi:MAG TPA: post-COAP-1 domain-containing protein [Chthoniobacterales bacterium]